MEGGLLWMVCSHCRILFGEFAFPPCRLMSSNFCPHLIFKFGDLIEFSVLKD